MAACESSEIIGSDINPTNHNLSLAPAAWKGSFNVPLLHRTVHFVLLPHVYTSRFFVCISQLYTLSGLLACLIWSEWTGNPRQLQRQRSVKTTFCKDWADSASRLWRPWSLWRFAWLYETALIFGIHVWYCTWTIVLFLRVAVHSCKGSTQAPYC